MSTKNITLIYNAQSGSTPSLATIRQYFTAASLSIKHTYSITSASFEKNIRRAAKRGDMIAVIGGDGTVSGVVSYIAQTQAVLIPLPGGTLNNFTKDLGIPQDLEQAIIRIPQLKQRKIDLGRVNTTYFVNNSSIGIYPQSLVIREGLQGKISKWPAAFYAVAKAFVQFRTYTISINGQSPFKTPFIFVGNNRYNINNFAFTDRKNLNDGVLSLYTIKTTRRTAFLKLFFAITTGKLKETDEFNVSHPTSISVATTRRKQLVVSHDGEVSRMTAPLSYQSEKQTITVLG